MRQRNMLTGLDMEQHSQSFVLPPDINVSSSELYDNNNNNSMFYRLPPQSHHHQRPSNPGPAMSTPPNLYLPYAPFHAPPLAPGGGHGVAVGGTSTEHERNAHVMGQGHKRKSTQVMPGNFHYPSTAEAAPCSFPPETAPFSFPHCGPQPVDQRIVRNRAGATTMDPPVSHSHNNFSQGSYPAHPFPPPGSAWYDQHSSGNTSDGSSFPWPQPPYVPYMHGNNVIGYIDSGNVCFPRYNETSSSRNTTPFLYPRYDSFSHHPAPPPPPHLPPTIYPHLASASYTVPVTIHNALYSHLGPVQSTGFRINQHPQEDFVPAATLRHHGLPRFRAIPSDEFAVFGEGGFYDAVDYHQDMRLDIEDMSYEELLALSDHIGTVKTGLSEEDVEGLLKTRTSVSARINMEEAPSTDLETHSCTICQENYKNRDKFATLECRHEYHVECLKKWLVIKNICPVCKSEALVMEKKER